MSSVRIPRPIRKAVKLALATPDEDHACAACRDTYSVEPSDDATACCHPCAQMLLAMLASYVECLRTGRKYT
jgi:ribosomal protein L37AE/L43A